MNNHYHFRTATADDAGDIARLIAISSDGVAEIEWAEQAQQENCDPLEIGERTYQNPKGDYSWRNCTIVEHDHKSCGMLLTFAMPDGPTRDQAKRPTADDENVFAPYIYLEESNSWYICGIALFPEHRGRGIGSQLMQQAHEEAKQHGYSKLSLVAFEQNAGSVRLYQKLGYEVVDHAPIVPHPLIHYTGEALLMVANV